MSWNPDADLNYAQKQEVLRSYFERYRPSEVVETGLYAGNGSCLQFRDRAHVTVVDTDPANIAAMAPDVTSVLGDSARLEGALHTVRAPALFWLDAHVVTAEREENYSPLLAELDAILAWPHAAQSVVLIDDVRMMGLPGWPTLEQVRAKVGETWAREERDDIMRLTPK